MSPPSPGGYGPGDQIPSIPSAVSLSDEPTQLRTVANGTATLTVVHGQA